MGSTSSPYLVSVMKWKDALASLKGDRCRCAFYLSVVSSQLLAVASGRCSSAIQHAVDSIAFELENRSAQPSRQDVSVQML